MHKGQDQVNFVEVYKGLVYFQATLEFVMPTHLVKETLETVKLSRLG